jgi:uncharacterized membrane protein
MKGMKRIIRILLFITVIILAYMCVASIRQGMVNDNTEKTSVVEDFENENPAP